MAQSGPQIYLQLDFDAGENRFKPTDSSRATLVAAATARGGRSLHVERARDGSYIGATVPLQIKGSLGLRIAFVVRAKAMQNVGVNVFDQRRSDNTTPASPARIFDDAWHTVVFAAEDFHYNSDPPDRKIEPETDFVSLMFHGQGAPGAEFWVDKLVVYRGRDDRPPQAPSLPVANAQADGAVLLTWQEPTDNTFAVVYSIQRKLGTGAWEKVGESLRPSFTDRPSSPGLHVYRITAADYENNVSSPSSEVTATVPTPPAGIGDKAAESPWVTDRANYGENVRQIPARGTGKVRPDVFLFAGDSLTAATVYTHVLGSWLARGLTVRQGVGTVTTEYGAANIKRYLTDAKPEFAVVMYAPMTRNEANR
jgi:hypothetical protein